MPKPPHPLVKDVTGKNIGDVRVLRRIENGPQGSARFLCQHPCGHEVVYFGFRLRARPPEACPLCAERLHGIVEWTCCGCTIRRPCAQAKFLFDAGQRFDLRLHLETTYRARRVARAS